VDLLGHLALALAIGFILPVVPATLLLVVARLGRPDLHWTEKARRLAPARLLLGLGQTFYPILIAGMVYGMGRRGSLVPAKVEALLAMISAFLGGWLAASLVSVYLSRVHEFPPVVGGSRVLRLYLSLVPYVSTFVIAIVITPENIAIAVAVDIAALGLFFAAITDHSVFALCSAAFYQYPLALKNEQFSVPIDN